MWEKTNEIESWNRINTSDNLLYTMCSKSVHDIGMDLSFPLHIRLNS